MHTTVHVWKPEDKFLELVFLFHLYMGCEGTTQVAKLERQALGLLNLLNQLGRLTVKRCFVHKDKHTKVFREAVKSHDHISSIGIGNCLYSETPGYLLDAISPALPDSVPGPHVVSIFSQLVHHCFLRGGEFYKAQIHWGRLVSTGQLVTAKQTEKLQIAHFVEIM